MPEPWRSCHLSDATPIGDYSIDATSLALIPKLDEQTLTLRSRRNRRRALALFE
jgi:hypothetical protein